MHAGKRKMAKFRLRSAESPRHFSSAEHISLFWSSFIRGEIRGLSWERKSCFLRGLSQLRLCASGQLSDLLMVLVLGVGAAGSQESLKRGAGVWGKERSDMDMPIQPQARCRQAPGKILWDSAGRSRLIGQKALSVYCLAGPLQKAGEVCQVRPGLEIPQAEETVPPNLLHTSPSLKYFLMLLSHLVGTLGLTGTHHLTMLFTRSQIRITGGRAWRKRCENRVGAVFTVWHSFEIRSHFVAQTSFPPFCLSLLRTRINYVWQINPPSENLLQAHRK